MKLQPDITKTKPIPVDDADEPTRSFLDELAIVANTSKIIEEIAGQPNIDPDEAPKIASLLERAIKDQDKQALSAPAVAYGARQFIEVYGKNLALEMTQVRHAIMNKLLELSNCGDARYELKAIELLGKTKDIGIFTEATNVTINYKSSSDLEEAIKDRVKRLLKSKIVDDKPLTIETLDDMLGAPAEKEAEEAEED